MASSAVNLFEGFKSNLGCSNQSHLLPPHDPTLDSPFLYTCADKFHKPLPHAIPINCSVPPPIHPLTPCLAQATWDGVKDLPLNTSSSGCLYMRSLRGGPAIVHHMQPLLQARQLMALGYTPLPTLSNAHKTHTRCTRQFIHR